MSEWVRECVGGESGAREGVGSDPTTKVIEKKQNKNQKKKKKKRKKRKKVRTNEEKGGTN